MKRAIALVAAGCVAGSVALPSAVTGVPPAAAMLGCFADNCTATGDNVFAEQGHMIDADTWESASYQGEWKPFFGADYIYFHGDFQGRVPYAWDIYISVSAHPELDGNSMTEATGNVALVSQVGPNQIAVTNGTCSKYYVRVVLHAPPAAPPPPVDLDAGDGGDASELDAGDPGGGDAGDLDAAEPDASDGN